MSDATKIAEGEPVALLCGRSYFIDQLVKTVAEETKTELDWHRPGNRAIVLCFGDRSIEEKIRVAQAICNNTQPKNRQPQMVKIVSTYLDFGEVPSRTSK